MLIWKPGGGDEEAEVKHVLWLGESTQVLLFIKIANTRQEAGAKGDSTFGVGVMVRRWACPEGI